MHERRKGKLEFNLPTLIESDEVVNGTIGTKSAAITVNG